LNPFCVLFFAVLRFQVLLYIETVRGSQLEISSLNQNNSNNAERVLKFVAAYRQFNNQNTAPFAYANWREGYRWEPQKTQSDAGRVASSGNKKILGYRKEHERSAVTAPLSAAVIAALGCESGRESIRQAIRHYDYAKINLCEFFLAECAYYALPPLTSHP